MSDDTIQNTVENGINTIRFNRADKKNAITADMYTAFTKAITQGEQGDEVRVHVILGQPGVFTAGNDLKDFLAKTSDDPGLGSEVLGFLRTLVNTTKPLVAGVDGLAIGIGTTMLMHCDLVYATARSFFQTPFTNLGLVPEAASSLIGPRLFGQQRAFALLAMGERWSAQSAFEAGLINKILTEQDLEPEVMNAATTLAAKPPKSLAITRQLLRGDQTETLARIDREAEYFSQQLASPEAQQAFAAFLNR